MAKKKRGATAKPKRKLAAIYCRVSTFDQNRGDYSSLEDAFENFDAIWEELDFDERQYAVRLLVKQIDLHLEKGSREGEMKIEAWGRPRRCRSSYATSVPGSCVTTT